MIERLLLPSREYCQAGPLWCGGHQFQLEEADCLLLLRIFNKASKCVTLLSACELPSLL
jgi:hypothetical protein